ncbi:MAG: universal stress protein [Desulfobacterales bacterium]|nr:universal stress protein [Desulfobacterales bacterium]MCP4163919.1 universal stress protein [Deltaproteobacteria bacterium]
MKILLGYDDSEESRKAAEIAMKHAKAFDADLYILSSLIGDPAEMDEEKEKTDKLLESAKSVFEDEGISCETVLILRGMSLGEDLIQFAKNTGIDEIIIGIKIKSRVGKFLFSSNAQYVVIKSPCPVVTVS